MIESSPGFSSLYVGLLINFSAGWTGGSVTIELVKGTDPSDATTSSYTGYVSPTFQGVSSLITPSVGWTSFVSGTLSLNQAYGAAFSVKFTPSGTGAASDYVEISRVMLTPNFRQMQVGGGGANYAHTLAGGTDAGELLACQRYYETSYAGLPLAIAPATVFAPMSGRGTVGNTFLRWTTTKQSAPTVTIWPDVNTTVGKVSRSENGSATLNEVTVTPSGTSRFGTNLTSTITANAWGSDAFHYTADAEIV